MAYRSRVVFSERSRPEIFCWVFAGRTSRSALCGMPHNTERDLRKRAEAAIATLTSQGRSVGVCVVGALQDPRKDVINFRNLFPTKIALRLDESDQVDMVLGDGARDRGALADEISPLPEVGAGVGYVRLEASPDPVRVRAAYVTDVDIQAMLAVVTIGGDAA